MKFFEQSITKLTDSNITQDYANWDPEIVYTYEDDDSLTNASVVTHNNYYWRSATINNTEESSESSLKWGYLNDTKDASVSNKLALLDNKTSTKTSIEDSDLYVEFERGQITTLVIGNFTASKIMIEQLDESKTVLSEYTQEYSYYPTFGVYDALTYGTAPFVYEDSSKQQIQITGIGKYIKITFYQNIYNKVSVGFLFGGNPISVGYTIGEIVMGFDSYITESSGSVETYAPRQTMTFQTEAQREFTDTIRQIIYGLRQEGAIRVFIADDSDSEMYKNSIILGQLQTAPLTIDSFDKHITSWTIYENP